MYSDASEAAPRSYARNFILLIGNYVTFGLALVCFGSSTVVPLFMKRLTNSTPLIGFVAILFPLCWLIPQLIAARSIADKPRRKPYLVIPSIGTPLVFVVLAAAMFLANPERAQWLLPLFIVCMAILGTLDGLVGVPWLDFIGSAIPAQVRGRLMGLQDLLYGFMSVGIGALVTYLLSEQAPPFPHNFAWLAVCAGVMMLIALICFMCLREPPRHSVAERQLPWSEFLPAMGRILRTDRVFARLIAVRLLAGMSQLSMPFYVLYATTELGLPASAVGTFITAQVVSAALGSMILGYVYERRGSRLIIRIVTLAGLCAPLIALLAPRLGLAGTPLLAAFALVFVAIGINGASLFLGYTNFIIEYCSPANRPAYLGLANTLAGPTMLAAILGGWVLQVTSYRFLFGLTLGLLLIVQVVIFGLPEPRRAKAIPE